MLKILVVEDDYNKLMKVSNSLREIKGIDVEKIENVVDARNAKEWLKKAHFDLLILDIAIPTRIDEKVKKDGGLDLLKEISEREIYNMPTHIVGMTALNEVYETVKAQMAENLVPFLYCDPTSSEWTKQLQTYVRRAIASELCRRDRSVDYDAFLCIVCALETIELNAILRNGWAWQHIHTKNDSTIYYEAIIHKNGLVRKCCAAAAPRKGMPTTAVLAAKMISIFRPRYLAMSGITSGYAEKTKFGDVIAANPAWDWGSGKFVKQKDKIIFEPEPYQLALDVEIRDKLLLMAKDDTALSSIRKAWGGELPSHELKLSLGPMASGAAVLADSETYKRVLQQHRGLLGVDMEAYAVFCAAQEAPLPRPKVFVLKSVVDFADADKDDLYQKYGAYTSAQVLTHFVQQYL